MPMRVSSLDTSSWSLDECAGLLSAIACLHASRSPMGASSSTGWHASSSSKGWHASSSMQRKNWCSWQRPSLLNAARPISAARALTASTSAPRS
eukprot:CAMPEP_0179937770 /NCGR_PEP_ID=MMETSP0983-20121128/14529_1 /TAXON_ID=483367 /ORGANISM="non described non described, Strain CCMP 2436" /LENGTH=93 /DNA_ID=CAMNT_0021843565 /DNA_START=156 /DNA_END=434 /DNA_ORIENTATION=-